MNGYRSMWMAISTGVALALAAAGCVEAPDTPEDVNESEAPAAPITNAWINQNFDGSTSGIEINTQPGWSPVRPGDHSPRAFFVGLDGTYDHKIAVKLVNREEGNPMPVAFTSARRAASQPTTARFQHLVFQVRVNDEVPAVGSNKGALMLHDASGAPLLKMYFTGTNFRLCGSDDTDCDNVWPKHDGPPACDAPFDNGWWRVVVFIDRNPSGTDPFAYAEVGHVGSSCVDSRTNAVTLRDAPIAATVLYEFSQLGGALLFDNILGFPSDKCCTL